MSKFTEHQCEQAEQQENAREDFRTRIANEIIGLNRERFTWEKMTPAEMSMLITQWLEIFDENTDRIRRECREIITSFLSAQIREHEAIETRAIRSLP